MRDSKRHVFRLVSVFLALAMIAAACGGSDGGDDAGGGDSGTATTAPPTTSAEKAEEVEKDVAEGDASGADEREVETGPVHGGRLVYGIEADSANPWVHFATSCAIGCYTAAMQPLADTLFLTNTDGEASGVLVDTATHSDDYLEWRFAPRKGIKFHDGTDFDAAAIVYNLNTCRASGLTGPGLSNVVDAKVEGDEAVFTMGVPWTVWPKAVAGGQCSYMFSPTWMKTLDANPLRNPDHPLFDQETADTPGGGDISSPVGTGPFVFDSYTPGNGNSLIAKRNADYWRGDGPNSLTDEGLPYLDEVEFVVAVDIASRSSSLESGQFDIIHTANSDEIVKFRGMRDDFALIEANAFGETNYILLNVAEGTNESLGGVPMDADGANASSPLLQLSCRKAMAHAIDRQRLADERGGGIVTPANGPFPPGSIGYLEDSGYPDYDLDAAAAEMETCLSEMGSDKISFTFNTTNDAFNVETNQLVVSMWQDAFGDAIDASIAPIEQGQYIGLALVGAFQAQGWRNHGGTDPDSQLLWWIPQTASPIGSLALNFGRFQDPVIAENMGAIRTQDDPAVRKEAAEAVNRAFGENVWNWWTTWTLWGVAADLRIQDITGLPLPDGSTGLPVVSGRHSITQAWCLEGDCQG